MANLQIAGNDSADANPSVHKPEIPAALAAIKQGMPPVSAIGQGASMRESRILAAPSPENFAGQVYYVSPKGSDQNDGKSPAAAWATTEQVNRFPFAPGDAVLFQRGGVYRNCKITAKAFVTYASFGEGEKPVLCGSAKNYANSALWQTTPWPDVYECVEPLVNVGLMAFDHSGGMSVFDEIVGTLCVTGVDGFSGPADLTEDLHFSSDLAENKLFLCSKGGNPGNRFSSIEIAEAGDLFYVPADGVTIDGLLLTFGGSHGIGSGGFADLTVKNCVFRWIGGSILRGYAGGDTVRYGNAVECYGSCSGFYVFDNYIYQIYDTGITHQYSRFCKADCHMENIVYTGNLVRLCHWSIEYYNQPLAGTHRWVKNVYVGDNLLQEGGFGWGSPKDKPQRTGGAALFNSFRLPVETENFVVEGNVFDRCAGMLVRLHNGGDSQASFIKNVYIQEKGRKLGLLFDETYPFDENAAKTIAEVYNEKDPVVFLL